MTSKGRLADLVQHASTFNRTALLQDASFQQHGHVVLPSRWPQPQSDIIKKKLQAHVSHLIAVLRDPHA